MNIDRKQNYMKYTQAFFALQLAFAEKMAELGGYPFAESVRRNTAMYRILGLDWDLDPAHPRWQTYIQGLPTQEDATPWTYRFYLENVEDIPEYTLPRWGCFSYDYTPKTGVIHIHFGNLDFSGYGPLSHQRREARLADLWSMFSHIKRFHPEARLVKGSSWLYNREAYTRLFPQEYAQSATPYKVRLIGRGLWGQFLRHTGEVSEPLVAQFLENVQRLTSIEDLYACFPYQLMLTEALIELFYDLYGIPTPA